MSRQRPIKVTKTTIGEGNHIQSIAFSPNGRYLVVGAEELIVVVDAHTGKVAWEMASNLLNVCKVNIAPIKGDVLAASSGDHLFIGSITGNGDHRFLRYFEELQHRGVIDEDAAFDPEDNNNPCLQSVAFSPDGSVVITGDNNGYLAYWEKETGKVERLIRAFDETHARFPGVEQLLFFPSKERQKVTPFLVTCSDIVQIWDPYHKKPKTTFKLLGNIYSAAITRNGSTIALGCTNNGIVLWENSNDPLRTLTEHEADVCALAYTANDKLISGDEDGTVMEWQADGEEPSNQHDLEEGGVSAIAVSPDYQGYAVATREGNLHFLPL